MGLWKDHPKEIETGGFGGDFPAPFRPAVAAAAWPPKVQEVEEPKPPSEKEEEKEDDEYKSRSWIKRALGLGETTPPRPGSEESVPNQDALRRLRARFKKTPKPRETGRVFDNQGQEVTGQVDSNGRPIAPEPAPVAPRSSQRSTASHRPRAEPIISHWTAGLGVGGPGGGDIPRNAPASSSRGYHHQ
ncbi:hypothetical protein E4T44_05890 [Aureobasidium sp. EXF-8845]|nr:hypothetical protein E4T44_05890 [Aureobasidium sp. EXF-8845]KAI4849612.1 hypothetical protein E4T45_05845 [Aureobasidium sp. EXF-8846]